MRNVLCALGAVIGLVIALVMAGVMFALLLPLSEAKIGVVVLCFVGGCILTMACSFVAKVA